MIVTLIGYRGSGKTTVADPLARRLGWSPADADVEIERRAGKAIRDIFRDEGEAHFRELERQVLADLLGRDRLVVSSGGGAVLNEQTRRLMSKAGPVVWLRASLDLIEQRINADESTSRRRPNLTPLGGRGEIEAVLAEREPIYRQCATLIIETDELSPAEIVERILAEISTGTNGGSCS